jgi:hypothetical protein
MKRLVIILFSLVFVATFCAQAPAVDVRFSGEYAGGGLYLDKTTLKKDVADEGPSTAFIFQRLRVRTDIVAAPGLMLITRFDAMERVWGAARSAPGTALDTASAGTRAENENIAFDWAYVQYDSSIGTFRAGYMNDNVWGTVFADTGLPKGKVAWSYAKWPWFVTAQIVKMAENSFTAKNPGVTASDVDNDKYCAAVKYSWKGGETGVLGGIGHDGTNRPAGNFKALFYTLIPYAIMQVGPVRVQAEADYFWGKWQESETGTGDVKLDVLTAWIDASVDFGKFYAGVSIAYVSGDDPGTTDKLEGNSLLINGGRDWIPCLILFNSDLSYWAGSQAGYNVSGPIPLNPYGYNAGPMTNAWFFQGRAGVRPIEKLDIMASVSFANADKKPRGNPSDPGTAYLYNDYGYEIDLTATYKLTDNLSYMLGVGYFFTGKYFRGASDVNQVHDDYLVINKLTLTF